MAPLVLSKFYKKIINGVDNFVPKIVRPFWMHPAGPKTVFFWAPIFKWGLVIAGIGDLKRTPQSISVNQTAVLAITGLIWSRYSFVVIPKNYALFSVNFFVGLIQLYQLSRFYNYTKKRGTSIF